MMINQWNNMEPDHVCYKWISDWKWIVGPTVSYNSHTVSSSLYTHDPDPAHDFLWSRVLYTFVVGSEVLLRDCSVSNHFTEWSDAKFGIFFQECTFCTWVAYFLSKWTSPLVDIRSKVGYLKFQYKQCWCKWLILWASLHFFTFSD